MLLFLDIIHSKPFLMHLSLTVFEVQNTTLERKIFHNKFIKSGKDHFITTYVANPRGYIVDCWHVLKLSYMCKIYYDSSPSMYLKAV